MFTVFENGNYFFKPEMNQNTLTKKPIQKNTATKGMIDLVSFQRTNTSHFDDRHP